MPLCKRSPWRRHVDLKMAPMMSTTSWWAPAAVPGNSGNSVEVCTLSNRPALGYQWRFCHLSSGLWPISPARHPMANWQTFDIFLLPTYYKWLGKSLTAQIVVHFYHLSKGRNPFKSGSLSAFIYFFLNYGIFISFFFFVYTKVDERRKKKDRNLIKDSWNFSSFITCASIIKVVT